MGLNRYSVKLFVYLVLVSGAGFAFFWSLQHSQLIITKILFALLFIVLFLLILRYLNKTNRDLNQFLESIKYLDSLPKTKSNDLSFDLLNKTYNSIIDQFKTAWIDKEQQYQYFQLTIQHMPVGILAFEKSGDIKLSNQLACAMLDSASLTSINNIPDKSISDQLINLSTGEFKLLKIIRNNEELKIVARAAQIKISGQRVTLVSLQNIKTQLEQSELEAWQKLIRVLTHEIMNSVTPIKSLTYGMKEEIKANTEQCESNDKIFKGLEAIEKRSKGLMQFVESYKNLTNIPKLRYERVEIKSLFDSIKELMNKELTDAGIKVDMTVSPENVSVIADEKMITQVLINLIQNAVYALVDQEDRQITLYASKLESNRICIQVKDNGSGISEDIIDKIFVPFYTTRKEGSGIGLSFARQVMVLHNGSINVQSKIGKETVFSLYF